MRLMHVAMLALLAGALSATVPVSAEQSPSSIGPIDPLYREVEAGMYFEEVPQATGSALTIDLGKTGRLTLPPRFAEQDVLEVKRVHDLGPGLEDAVVVGLQAGVPDGPTQAFVLVYGESGQQRVLKVELPLRQYYIGCEVLMLGQETVLVIHGASGAHFHDLWVYRFRGSKPELLLAKGSAAGVDLRPDPATGEPQVWVGIENWDDPNWNYASGKRLWNVYGWTGEVFRFSQALSTAPEVAVEDRANGYVQRVMSHLDANR